MPYKKSTKEHKTWKQFFSEWKQGMEKVTPLQQKKMIQWGQLITAIGIIWGIIFSIKLGYAWMAVILGGGMVVLGAQFLGNWQAKKMFQKIDEAYKNAELPALSIIPTEKEVSLDG